MSEQHITDEELMVAIRKNDYACYNSLFVRYYGRLCQYVYGMLADKEDTEDLVQELFLNLWSNRKKIEITTNVSAYLYKMAGNLTLNHIRATKRYQTLLEKQQQESLDDEEDPWNSDEFRIALYRCIERLPSRSRQILILHRTQGLKQHVIAEQLNISIQTIKNTLWSTLQKLRKCIELKGL